VPTDTFSHTAPASGSAGTIYSALQDPDTWKGIGPIDDVWDARHGGELLESFRWSARAAGRDWEGSARRTAHSEGSSITFSLDSSEIAGELSVQTRDTKVGAELTVTLTARSKGFLAGMFWGVISEALRDGFASQVTAFATRF